MNREQRRRFSKEEREHIKKSAQILTEDLADDAKIIAGGWAGYRLAVLPENASAIQVSETRKAFFAGAQYLFTSILNFLDRSDGEPTNTDLKRMENIQIELGQFIEELKQQHDIDIDNPHSEHN